MKRKLKSHILFFTVLFVASLLILTQNAITKHLGSRKNLKVEHIRKIFNKNFYSVRKNYGKFWVHLPEEISTARKTPIVLLLHGGVFNDVDYGKLFIKNVFKTVIENYNIIFVAPVMPRDSYPVWRLKDKDLICNTLKYVKQKFQLNPYSPVFVGGFSNGAEVALKLVLSGEIEAQGLFAFAGGCRLVRNEISENVDKNLPIFLSSGHNDGNWLGSIIPSHKLLQQKNFSNITVKGYPNLEHWISKDQASFLVEWIFRNI